MKKLNNKGFAASTLLYVLVIMMFLIVLALMSTLGTNRKNTKNLVDVIDDELNRYGLSNQTFSYDEDIDDVEARKVIIEEPGWYKIELWNTITKFTGVRYFNERDQINVHLRGSPSAENSYMTFGVDESNTRITSFNAVAYKNESKTLSTFSISKISDDDKLNVPLEQNNNTKLNNVRYIEDCVGGNQWYNNDHFELTTWADWQELQAIINGENVAKNCSVTARGGDQNEFISNVVNGNYYDGEDHFKSYTSGETSKCVKVDLGAQKNLDEIIVWHWYSTIKRYYTNHTISVSSDNNTFTRINTDNINKYETGFGIRYADRYKLNN